MVRFDLASLDSDPEGSGTDAEGVSRLRQIHPSFCYASIAIVARDVMRRAERDHPFSRPAIATPGEEPISIQNVGQQIIGTDPRQPARRLDDVLRRLRTILTPATSRQSQLGMGATLPVNDQDDFTGSRIDIDDDFVDQGSDEAFLQPNISVRTIPDGLKVGGEILEVLSCRNDHLALTLDVLIDTAFDLANTLQRLVPAPLQLLVDQSIIRVGRIELLLCSPRGVPR